jgi:hypothetical protein
LLPSGVTATPSGPLKLRSLMTAVTVFIAVAITDTVLPLKFASKSWPRTRTPQAMRIGVFSAHFVLRPFVRTREPRDGRAATANVNRETEWESSIFYSVG